MEHSCHQAALCLRAAKSICCFEIGHQEAGMPAIVWITRPSSQSWDLGSLYSHWTRVTSESWWAKLFHNQSWSFHPLPRQTQPENTCVLGTSGSNYRRIWAQEQERKCEADGQVIGHLKVFNELNISCKQESNAEKYFCPLLLFCHQSPTRWCSDVMDQCWKQNPCHKVRYVIRKTNTILMHIRAQQLLSVSGWSSLIFLPELSWALCMLPRCTEASASLLPTHTKSSLPLCYFSLFSFRRIRMTWAETLALQEN